MRLIDADYLIYAIEHELWDWGTVDGITATTVLKQTISDIKQTPTVDAVPVIRCKDCKYSTDEYGDGDCYCDLSVKYIGKDWNHFCSWAERKDNERVDSSR